MKHRSSKVLGVAGCVVGALWLVPGCAGKSIARGDDPDADSGGGRSGRGGSTSPTRGGAQAFGGSVGTAGTAGTIAVGGSSAGSGGVATCTMDGPAGTPDARRTVPFALAVSEQGGAGGADSGAGGIGDPDEPNGCTGIDYGYRCVGTARTVGTRIAPAFQFDDGSSLRWIGEGGIFVRPPAVDLGSLVWIEYQHEQPPVCPLCGSYVLTSLSIVLSEGGYLVWMGIEGSLLDELEPERVAELFGTSARRELACDVAPFRVDCYDVERDLFDHVLETNPEQRIPHATPTLVSTPGGDWDVFWASAEQLEVRSQCDDGRSPARDRGFAVSRLASTWR